MDMSSATVPLCGRRREGKLCSLPADNRKSRGSFGKTILSQEMIAQRLHVTRSAAWRSGGSSFRRGNRCPPSSRLLLPWGGEDPAAAEIRSCTAEDCMSRPILVGAESNAYDAAVLLFTEDIGTLFVGKKDDIQGVVSRKDLLKAAIAVMIWQKCRFPW